LYAHLRASSGGSPTDWAGSIADYEIIAGAFLASLRNVGVFDRVLPSTRRMPFRSRIVIQSQAITGSDVAEGSAKTITELEFGADVLDFKKAVGLLVVSDELLNLAATQPGRQKVSGRRDT
jgi:hypothetical protein